MPSGYSAQFCGEEKRRRHPPLPPAKKCTERDTHLERDGVGWHCGFLHKLRKECEVSGREGKRGGYNIGCEGDGAYSLEIRSMDEFF